ncbi:MAG: hypothetical protein GWN16_16565, partial [Calditrichae bacterium]|nr:hypothetical protein [Calditrichia bacterium]
YIKLEAAAIHRPPGKDMIMVDNKASKNIAGAILEDPNDLGFDLLE